MLLEAEVEDFFIVDFRDKVPAVDSDEGDGFSPIDDGEEGMGLFSISTVDRDSDLFDALYKSSTPDCCFEG